MIKKNPPSDPPAFPSITLDDAGNATASPGLTRRDYFAAAILQGMIANHGWTDSSGFSKLKIASVYEVADQVLQVRGGAGSITPTTFSVKALADMVAAVGRDQVDAAFAAGGAAERERLAKRAADTIDDALDRIDLHYTKNDMDHWRSVINMAVQAREADTAAAERERLAKRAGDGDPVMQYRSLRAAKTDSTSRDPVRVDDWIRSQVKL